MYIVYKTTNVFDNCVYVGVHKVKPKYDYYLGSGVRLLNAIKKHGAENFKRETLFECDCAEEAYWLEKIILPLWFVKRRDVYNLQTGGMGLSSERAKEITNRPEHIKRCRKQFTENNPMNNPKLREKARKNKTGIKHNMTKEGIKRLSTATKKRQNMPVNRLDSKRNFIERFESIKQASKITGADEWRISKACRNLIDYAGTKKTGPMFWEYANKKEG